MISSLENELVSNFIFLLQVMGGILLIVTSSGKIVFISSHVEGLLGYQTVNAVNDYPFFKDIFRFFIA